MTNITIIENRDIFESKCQVLVNPINCVGVMGKGLALEFKNRYPKMFDKYKNLCDKYLIDIGRLWMFNVNDNKQILNFPTKKDWKDPSQYEYIEEGMDKFVKTYQDKNIKSIAFPLLGCGNGNLNKDIVLQIMTKYLIRCKDLNVEIYYN